MSAIPLFKRFRGLQYTGSNAAEVIAFVGDTWIEGDLRTLHLISSDSSQVSFEIRMTDYPTDAYTVLTGNWVITQSDGVIETNATPARISASWKTSGELLEELTTAPEFKAAVLAAIAP